MTMAGSSDREDLLHLRGVGDVDLSPVEAGDLVAASLEDGDQLDAELPAASKYQNFLGFH